MADKSTSGTLENLRPARSSTRHSAEKLTHLADCLQGCLDAFPKVLFELTLCRAAEFLALEPPDKLSQRHRVFLAGLAELVCNHLALQVPPWTEKTEYFLVAEWDVCANGARTDDDDSDLAPPEFRRRKIRF
jgi:hypothetical protein